MPKTNRRTKNLAIVAFASAFLLWGLNTPLIKLSLGYIPIYPLLTLKFLVGGLFLLFFKPKKWKKVSRVIWFRIFISTVIGYVLTLVLFYTGIKRAGGLNASLIYLTAPIFIYLLSMRLLKEHFNSKFLLGVSLGVLGAILLVGAPLFIRRNVYLADFMGSLLIFMAVLADAVSSTIIKPVLKIVPSKQVTTSRFLIAAIIILPLGIMDIHKINYHVIGWTALFSIAYNIIFATIIAFSLYHYGLSKISGEQSSSFYYLDPLAGVIGSLILLHEQLTPVMLLGGLLVVAGVIAGETKITHYHLLRHH